MLLIAHSSYLVNVISKKNVLDWIQAFILMHLVLVRWRYSLHSHCLEGQAVVLTKNKQLHLLLFYLNKLSTFKSRGLLLDYETKQKVMILLLESLYHDLSNKYALTLRKLWRYLFSFTLYSSTWYGRLTCHGCIWYECWNKFINI